MPSRTFSSTLVVGSVAASATTGALLAIGHRMGSAGLPFAAISALGLHETLSGGAFGLVFIGLVLHVLTVAVWSFVFTALVRAVRWRVWAAAATVAVGDFAVSWLVARLTGDGLASVLVLGDRLVYTVVLAGALVVGMRFAFLPLREH